MPRQLVRPVKPLSASGPRAGVGQHVAVRDEVCAQVARLRVLAAAARHVAVVAARATLREEGAVGADAGPAPVEKGMDCFRSEFAHGILGRFFKEDKIWGSAPAQLGMR